MLRPLCSYGHKLGLELHTERMALVSGAIPALYFKFLSAPCPGVPAFGFNWWWLTVMAMTKHFAGFQEPHGHVYTSFDMKKFVSALHALKKLPIIWRQRGDLPSQWPTFRFN